jgi:HEAT repeat protein
MGHLAGHGDATAIYETLIAEPDPLLERGTLSAARWLRDTPREAGWRSSLLTRLVGIFQEGATLGLRAQALTALALSGDPNAAGLFRQLLEAASADLRALAALGCGIVRDGKATEPLMDLLRDHDPVVRRAASLALVRIGAHTGLLALAAVLEQGDEDSRRAAAESLANNVTEGWETLREGAGSQDILLRRAAVFGLARVEEPWAVELLEKIQVEDEQWVVRTLAVEFVEARHRPSARVPHKLTAPADTPWLIEFAGRYGIGITPGQPSTDLLLLALKSDREAERLAALNYLRYIPGEGVLAALFGCIYGPDPEVREAAYYYLWEMSISGAKVPTPQEYGLG